MPWVLPAFEEGVTMMDTNPARINLMVFKAAFAKKRFRRDRNSMGNADQCRQVLMAKGPLEHDLAMTAHPSKIMQEVHVFAYSQVMQNIGPELHSVGTMKVLSAKTSDLLMFLAPFADLQPAVTQVKSLEKKATMADVQHMLRDITQESFDSLVAAGAIFYQGVIPERSLVYIPSGWLVMEKTVSGVCTGIQVSLLYKSKQSHRNLQALAGLTEGMHLSGPSVGSY